MAEANADPARLPFTLADHERGRTADELWEAAIADLRAMVEHEGADGVAGDRHASTTSSRSTSSCARRAGREGAIEYYAVMNFVEADMHNAVVEVLREDIGGVRGHAGDRRRHGSAAQRVLRRAAARGPPRGRGVRHRAGPRRGRRPLQDGGGALPGGRRLRHLHRAVLRAADDRDAPSPSRTTSAAPSASSTTTPRPRSCSRCASASGRRTTASWAARR